MQCKAIRLNKTSGEYEFGFLVPANTVKRVAFKKQGKCGTLEQALSEWMPGTAQNHLKGCGI
jgi:hypothetical protein